MTPAIAANTPQLSKQQPWMQVGMFDFGKALVRGTDYFNCGIVDRPDGRWLVTRRAVWRQPQDMGVNDVMAFKLDGLTPVWGKKVDLGQRFENEHFEDPRVIYHGGRTFVSACNFIRNKRGCTYPHQVLCEVNSDWGLVSRQDPVYGKNRDGFVMNLGHEKNWLWFFHQDTPAFVYQADPQHEVLVKSTHYHRYLTDWSNPWELGTIRGGTPPVLVNGEYWTFFHSSVRLAPNVPQYHMGAYAFEPKPPFRITKITPEPLLSGSQRDKFGGGKPMVVFPCGAIYEPNQSWLVVGGSNDLECFHARFAHADLLKQVVEL